MFAPAIKAIEPKIASHAVPTHSPDAPQRTSWQPEVGMSNQAVRWLLAQWAESATGGVSVVQQPSGGAAPADVNVGFNPMDITHRLLVAIDQTEWDFWKKTRHVDFPAVVSVLSNLTLEQVTQVENMYREHEKRSLNYDLFGGGDSGFPTDLKKDERDRLRALLGGTRASANASPDEAQAARDHQLEADSAELHALLHGDREEADVERIMALLRRSPSAHVDLSEAYERLYGIELFRDVAKLGYADMVRATMLRAGQVVVADRMKVGIQRNRIAEIDRKIELLAMMPMHRSEMESLKKERKRLVGDIEARVQLAVDEGRAEAAALGVDTIDAELAAQSRAGEVLGDSAEFASTVKGGDAAVILATAQADPAAKVATQLRRSSEAGTLKAADITAALRGLRNDAQAAAERELPDGTPDEIATRARSLATEYFLRLREIYNVVGGEGPSFNRLLSETGGETEVELNNLLMFGRGVLDDVTELELALRGERKDLETVKRVLRYKSAAEIADLKKRYAVRTNDKRSLEGDLFGDAPTRADEENPEFKGMYMKSQGKASATDRLELEDYMQRPEQEGGAEEVRYLAARAEREYEYTIDNRGATGAWRDFWGNEVESLLNETIETVRAASAEYLQMVGYVPFFGMTKPQQAHTERAHELLHQMRLARATIRGDRAAYEKATAELRATFQAVAAFALQTALMAVLGPVVLAARVGQAASAGMRALSAWARSAGAGTATNIASNAMVYGKDYSVERLKGDLQGGFGGSIGTLATNALVGPVAKHLAARLGPKLSSEILAVANTVGATEGAGLAQGRELGQDLTLANFVEMHILGKVSNVAETTIGTRLGPTPKAPPPDVAPTPDPLLGTSASPGVTSAPTSVSPARSEPAVPVVPAAAAKPATLEPLAPARAVRSPAPVQVSIPMVAAKLPANATDFEIAMQKRAMAPPAPVATPMPTAKAPKNENAPEAEVPKAQEVVLAGMGTAGAARFVQTSGTPQPTSGQPIAMAGTKPPETNPVSGSVPLGSSKLQVTQEKSLPPPPNLTVKITSGTESPAPQAARTTRQTASQQRQSIAINEIQRRRLQSMADELGKHIDDPAISRYLAQYDDMDKALAALRHSIDRRTDLQRHVSGATGGGGRAAFPESEFAGTTARGFAGPKSANVISGEEHHIATRFGREIGALNKQMFETAFGTSRIPVIGHPINHPINLMTDFVPHGQIRGWHRQVENDIEYIMRGHHREYNEWVTNHLLEVITTPGLTFDQTLRRFVQAQYRLRRIIARHPDVLIDGPRILPPFLQNLTVAE